MTDTQKQCLLVFLGYDTGGIGNGWGPKSRNALECCQEDLGIGVDGIWGPQTETAVLEAVYTWDDAPQEEAAPEESAPALTWEDIKYFRREEFRCKCGGKYCGGYPAEMDLSIVHIADRIREYFGKPARVNSGLRCPVHNKLRGGASQSYHMSGHAIDIGTIEGTTPREMYDYAETLMQGRGGLGLYDWGIHIDNGDRVWRG